MKPVPTSEVHAQIRPFTNLGKDTEDQRYAESNSCRQDFIGKADLVTHSCRQLVYNVHGFKMRKGVQMSAALVAQFWEKEVRVAASQQFMTKKSTIDTCLTLFERIFSIEDAEAIVIRADAVDGAESAWNSLWRLQEIVYRCGTKGKIVWTLQAIDDWIRSGKISQKDVTVTALKTGGKSLTDVALFQQKVKSHLLGSWLDHQPFPSYMKDKLRQIFASHVSYRKTYNPIGIIDGVDTTWLLKWPKVGNDLVGFIEGMCYMATPSDEAHFRLAVIMTTHGWESRIVGAIDVLWTTQ